MVIGYGCFLYENKNKNKYFYCIITIETYDYMQKRIHFRISNTAKHISSNYKILKTENILTNDPDINIHDFLRDSKIEFYLHKKIAIDRFIFRHNMNKCSRLIILYDCDGDKLDEFFYVGGKIEGYMKGCPSEPYYINGKIGNRYNRDPESESENDYFSYDED